MSLDPNLTELIKIPMSGVGGPLMGRVENWSRKRNFFLMREKEESIFGEGIEQRRSANKRRGNKDGA